MFYLVLSFSLCVCLRLLCNVHAMAAEHVTAVDAIQSDLSWTRRSEDYHGSNTIFLVSTLMSVVGGVFVVFATMALCYRSVVVHKNFSLCLRLVRRLYQVEIHVFSQHPLHFSLLRLFCISLNVDNAYSVALC